MNRRGFLGSILAAAVAPAIVRADSLMRIVPMETTVLHHVIGDFSEVTHDFGGAIREWVQYDLKRDLYMLRLDVMVDAGNELRQYHVDAQFSPSEMGVMKERVRAPALEVLKAHARHHGGKPVRGALGFPQGAHRVEFLA